MKIRPFPLLLLLSIGTASGQASVFEVTSGRTGNVLALGASGSRPDALQGIVLLPIESVGRTRLTELDEGQARRRDDVPGASRLLLPADRGSLYKYRRAESGRPDAFGYFRVDPLGQARSVFELPATGPAGDEDPLPGRVAVATDGASVLVGSSLAAGGDLYEIDLEAGRAVLRTACIAPQTFGHNGLLLLETWGFAVSEEGVFRFERCPFAGAGALRMPCSATWFGPDLVRSADGSTVAFLAGECAERALVFTCRSQGVVVQASDRAMHVPGAGYLPEDPTGPSLALSPDGALVAWRAEGPSRECFVRETRALNRPASRQLTGPDLFDDTLNDTGVISFFEPRVVGLAMGWNASDGLVRGDFFRISIDSAGVPTPENLTRTSDILEVPFDYGTLATGDGLFRVPGRPSSFLVLAGRAYAEYEPVDVDSASDPEPYDPHHLSETGQLLWIEAGGVSRVLLEDVSALDSVEVAGSFLVACVRRPAGIADPGGTTLSLVQIPCDGTGEVVVVPLPPGCRVSRGVGSRALDRHASILESEGGERLGQVRIPSPLGLGLGGEFHTFGPTMSLSPEGWILASVDLGPVRLAFAWTDVGTVALRASRNESFLLPGL